jgi:hypothetical protein
MQFSGSVMTLGNVATPGAGNVVEVNDLAGIRYQGTGTFLAADTTGVAAWTADRLLFSDVGTQGPTAANFGLNSSSSNPLFSFTGAPIGTHTFKDSLLDLRAFVVGAESDPDFSGNTSDGEPLRHSGDLVRLTSTSMQVGSAGGGNAIKLDVALFNATAPLLNMTASSLTTPSDFLKLTNQSKLTGNLLPADALVKLDASTLNVLNGVLANVAGGFGGSFMNLTNTTLLSLTNGSTVNISANLNNFDAGALVRVAGGSVYKMTGGSLISFGTGTNTVNINNGSSIVGCSGCSLQNVSFNGSGGALAPVLFKNGAGPGNVQVTAGFNPFPGLGGANTLNIGGGTSALFIVDGGTSKVVLKP